MIMNLIVNYSNKCKMNNMIKFLVKKKKVILNAFKNFVIDYLLTYSKEGGTLSVSVALVGESSSSLRQHFLHFTLC